MGNTQTSKTHYRKVFKSDHLGVADLEDLLEQGSNLIFVIDHVNQEFGVRVAGKTGNHNIAYFKEGIKPFVLNATNSKIMKSFANGSAFVEDWVNIPVRLYIEKNIRFGNSVVEGVRIDPKPPRAVVPLTSAQAIDINDRLKATNSDIARFLLNFKSASVETIPKDQYNRALNLLKAKEAAL